MTALPSSTLPDTTNPISSVITQLIKAGWTYVPSSELDRAPDERLLRGELSQKLATLNHMNSSKHYSPERAITTIESIIRGTTYPSLVNSNEELTKWLRGAKALQAGDGTYKGDAPRVKFIDFETIENNSFIVSNGVEYVGWDKEETVFDLVLWINGIPVVVGETHNNDGVPWVDIEGSSWVDAAKSISDDHERRVPDFFGTNIFSFCIGRGERSEEAEFRFGGVRCPVDKWERWGSTKDPYDLSGITRVNRSIELLLSPRRLLSIVEDFTLYDRTERDGKPSLLKVTPRYPQVEAVEAIYDRATKSDGKQGLVIQHQGSGKTLAMAFTALKLYRSKSLKDATIVVVADRKDLIEQLHRQFEGVGVKPLHKTTDGDQLKNLLKSDEPKVVVTTVQKFRDIGELNQNENIIVLIDEAHRTQEGTLGSDLRTALPNARFFGFTGTPIATKDKNTFKLFGSKTDPGWVLNEYSATRSLADGTVVPMKFDLNHVKWQVNKEIIERVTNEVVADNNLTEDEADSLLSEMTSVKSTIYAPDRITGVCENLVDHFYSTIDPQGMKAQIVAFDRETCIAYGKEIKRILERRGSTDEVEVVISYNPLDKDNEEMLSYRKSASKVTEVTQRFNSSSDKLKFLIVTSMLCTGFDAPIEGVMYLDKPMRNHTLYQTMCRVNRKWESKAPQHPSRKEHGLVVDYFGLGEKIAQAMLPVDPNIEMLSQLDKDELLHEFSLYLGVCLRYFKDIPRTKETVHEAELHLERTKNKEPFQINFGVMIEIWKKLYPHSLLKQCGAEIIWLSEVYAKCTPSDGRDEFIAALKREAVALMQNNMFNVIIDPSKYSGLLLDADAVHALHTGAVFVPDDFYDSPATIDDAIRKAMEKLHKLVEKRHERSPYIELIDYLDDIYEMYLNRIANAAETLHSALGVMDEAEALRASEDVSDENVEAAVERILLTLAPSLSEVSRLEICVQVETAIADILESTEATPMEVVDMWGQSLMDYLRDCTHSSGLPVIMSDYVAKMVRRRSHDRGEMTARIT